MLRKLGSLILAFVMPAMLAWGQCVLCAPVVENTSEDHGCCKPAKPVHCGIPENGGDKKDCPKHPAPAQSLQKSEADSLRLVQAVTVAVIGDVATEAAFAPQARVRCEAPVPVHSPPDLYLLHSSLLI